jgi:hypothetical protein
MFYSGARHREGVVPIVETVGRGMGARMVATCVDGGPMAGAAGVRVPRGPARGSRDVMHMSSSAQRVDHWTPAGLGVRVLRGTATADVVPTRCHTRWRVPSENISA